MQCSLVLTRKSAQVNNSYSSLVVNSVDKTLTCDHFNETFREVLPSGVVRQSIFSEEQFKKIVKFQHDYSKKVKS